MKSFRTFALVIFLATVIFMGLQSLAAPKADLSKNQEYLKRQMSLVVNGYKSMVVSLQMGAPEENPTTYARYYAD